MDNFDRKSTVSSFYGRKSSEPLQQTRPESPSSFYSPDRHSRADFGQQAYGSAGYNRHSFFPGRQEPLRGGEDEEMITRGKDDSWDIYADFNNAGPRYSTAFGQPSEGYQPVPTPIKDDGPSSVAQTEIVTVPALGPEWKKSEMRDMTKSGRKEKKAETRRAKWTAFKRGETGLCGIKWLNRRTLAFILFGLAVAICIILVFTIPRVPSFAFSADTPLAEATGNWGSAVSTTFSRAPANFSFPAFAVLQVNTQDNFLPVHFNHMRAQVFDLDTGREVAHGDLAGYTVPAKAYPIVNLPLNFTYVATNDTDQTWKNWYEGCRNKGNFSNGKRPAVKFRLLLNLNIRGLPSSHSAATQISDASCPIELPMNSV